jgi:L-fucose mutarotase
VLTYDLVHPPLLAAIARLGHGDRLLLADGNFPVRSATKASAEVVHLNLRPGLLSIPDVLAPLLAALPVESAVFMGAPDGSEVPAHADYRDLLGPAVEHRVEADRWAFYDQTRTADVVVATADVRLCSNLVLTVGVHTTGGPR